MHILFVGQYPNKLYPYRNVFFRNIIYEMADKGIECTVIDPVSVTCRDSLITKHLSDIRFRSVEYTEKNNPVTVYRPKYVSYSAIHIGAFNSGIMSEKSFRRCAAKTAEQLQDKFDAVYGHFFIGGGLAAVEIGRQRNIPAFVAYGECDYNEEVVWKYRELDKTDIEGLSGIIAVSSSNAAILESKEIFSDIPILVAPNGVDGALFYKRDKSLCRNKLSLPQDKFIVSFVGGFIERKGDKRLLEAANKLDDVYLVFAGKGDNPPSGERVLMCRPAEHDEIPVLLNAADAFCLPTLKEGCCNAIIEAMACGLPVISSDMPFNRDILDADNALLVDPCDIDDISKAIMRLKSDGELMERMSEASLESAEKLTISTRADSIIGFIENCI